MIDIDQDNEASGSGSAARKVGDADALFRKLKGWFKRDYDSEGQTRWRREAREDFDFEAGEQLTAEDKQVLQDLRRPVVIFNQVGTYVDSVAGQEVANRQEVQFIPRNAGDVKKNELLTSAAMWFRDQCDAEDEESDAFRDLVVCGMGWTETRLDYEDNPQGDPKIERVDPLEMVWDSSAKKRNLIDRRRQFQIRRNITLDEARALCPGDPENPFEDEDYNASWVDDRDADGTPHENDGRHYDKEPGGERDADDECVTLVRAQWIERVPCWLVLDPFDQTGQNILTLDEEEYRDLGKKMKIAGAPTPKAVKQTRKVYRQAYLGNVLLEIGDAPVRGRFSFQCMTGKRDRNRNTFFGVVRAMKDPSRWANKWLMQTMHIMNSTAKGGIAVERGQFFDDDDAGAESWAKQDQVTFLKPGALGQNPKMMAKPSAQFPQGSFELMQFAFGAMGRVSGINLEAVGMQTGSGQAAALDLQRKQAVMTLMQPLFDGLRRYRKEQGRVLLYLIENYLSDGRLVKIQGPENAKYVQLVRSAYADDTAQGYDVIVDEAPTSANQKEYTWAMLQQILPVIGKMLPPATWLALLKYSPLPTSAQKDISDSIQQAQQGGDPEQQKRDAELQFVQAKQQADIDAHKALTAARVDGIRQEAAAKRDADMEHARHKAVMDGLTTPFIGTGPDGQPVQMQGQDGGQAALIMSFLAEMRRDMNTLAAAMNTPKQLIRNEQGDIVGIAPMQQG
ncbi:hypothetical protein VRZ08_01040 [Rhodopseudomonas sp. G2_2311]|uniref:portal protein n=1 Tax=Rhodopseudomonas sp. G2_2311 TaxID=3114287 RepID=UPI0039C71E7C